MEIFYAAGIGIIITFIFVMNVIDEKRAKSEERIKITPLGLRLLEEEKQK